MNKTFLHKYKTYLISLDCIAIIFSFVIAYVIRFKTIIPNAESDLEFSYFKISLILVFSSIYTLNRDGQYNWTRHKNIISSQLIALLISISAIYIFKGNKVSRLALAIYFIISTLLLALNRSLIKQFITPPHCLLIGDSPLLDLYKNKSEKQTFTQIKSLDQVTNLEIEPDHVVISFINQQQENVEKIIEKFSKSNTHIQILPYYKYDVLKHELSDSFHIPILALDTHALSWGMSIFKRSFDILFSTIFFSIFFPFLLIISCAVKLTSHGPIFYGQTRMGLDGKKFTMWKFRSMKTDAERDTGAVWAKENDPRVTPIGAFLRKTSIDELPQFWNVLKGDMSLVGPRPERPELINKFRHEIPSYMLRHRMKAGVTGWAQINGLRGNCDLNDRIKADIFYIKNWSLYLDFKIVLLTIKREIFKI